MEKVSNENKSKDDTTVNNPVAANESSNVIRPATDFTVTTNAAISTDTTTASATMLTIVAASTTAGAAASQSKLCAAGATCTHSQGPADLSGSIFKSITDAVATTANDDNGEKVDGKGGNGINDQRQILDTEIGRETFNNNEIESNYEEKQYERNGG